VSGSVLLGRIDRPKAEKVTGGSRKLDNEKVHGDLWGSGGVVPRILNLDTR